MTSRQIEKKCLQSSQRWLATKIGGSDLLSSVDGLLNIWRHSVKAVDTLSIALPPIPNNPEARSSTTLICTISSDGKVRLFDLASLPTKEPSPNETRTQLNPVGEYDTKGTRLTCMAIADGDIEDVGGVNGKRKREEEQDEDEDDEQDGQNVDDDGDEEEEEENEEVEMEGEDEDEESD